MASFEIEITGKVQGVGLRPAIYRYAQKLSLKGYVTNTGLIVKILIQGTEDACDEFIHYLDTALPPLANIQSKQCRKIEPTSFNTFEIIQSAEQSSLLSSPPADLAVCTDCVQEMFSPLNRRYLHPFISCTNCGPRFSVVKSLPYERHHTSWAEFEECPICKHDKNNPTAKNRRFHSQGNSCNECGPVYHYLAQRKLSQNDISQQDTSQQDDRFGTALKHHKAIQAAVEDIKKGKVIAVKGLSGIHLVCDANNTKAISTLRKIKNRPDKPFAVMALNTGSLKEWVAIEQDEIDSLTSPAAPIVLIPKRHTERDQHLAPGMSDLACMLPNAPIHLLLFYYWLHQPSGNAWLTESTQKRLVITSANLSGQALHFDNECCYADFSHLIDGFLFHDRDIINPCDDSIKQSGTPDIMVRRARGYVPSALNLNATGKLTSYGAHFKNTFCVQRDNQAFVSPYLGELNASSVRRRANALLQTYACWFSDTDDQLACDLHPDYASSHLALESAQERDLKLTQIQHHMAHFSAVLAEHRIPAASKALGLVLDGVGLGSDGQLWGGELFIKDQLEVDRIGHLQALPLPGGDKAVKEIWRLGACLISRLAPERLEPRYKDFLSCDRVKHFIDRGQHIQSTSLGRWFDAIASVIGLRQQVSFDAQAAMELEAMASQVELPSALGLIDIEHSELKMDDLVLHLLDLSYHTDDVNNRAQAAAVFHSEIIDALQRWVQQASHRYDCNTIAISGGCLQNRILREGLYHRLISAGFEVYLPKLMPPNDEAISLGQAWATLNEFRICDLAHKPADKVL